MSNNKNKFKIKLNVWKLPNKMHFEIQKNSRAVIFKPKKGKGSYTRKNKIDE